ncbi:MAG TPA: helix-turn-helix transcriptional regulator [Clostridiales bacterium]|nr:helix-turn-helix transcriptional regulator [Clostridiales bacterium]
MKLNIGENIKHLRKEKDITQEEFASVIGVSYQSVSRWENNTCYPDMELLPTIADFFGTSIDKLLGVDEIVEKAHVAQYLERFRTAISQGRVYDCIDIAREGVAEYPNNFVLLDKLMYALFVSGDEDGDIPEWEENMKKNDAEITALGERIMKYCLDQDIRLEATARLAFNHCEMGRKEIGRAIFEALPSANQCRENVIWWCLTDDQKLPFTRDRIQKGYEILSAGMYSLLCYRLLPDEELLKVYEKRIELDKLIYDGNVPNNDWGSARFHCNYAGAYSRLGMHSEALEQLKTAAQCANDFDNRPDESTVSTLLLGDIAEKKTDFETGDSRSLTEIMRDKWLADEDFDSIRDCPEFKAIIESLS